ncbi:MAG: pyridoxamine 5'-phosphate oxidase family protein [Schwartzia sp.]|nr:pyridoxamine 5'-phosphate oxidase family protein [Schwartzia sp. (in: firmicutes)]
MFREMRRKNQQLPEAECRRILREATSGVLAVAGDDGYPYAVPLSFAYADGRLYFHAAKTGHKLDALRQSPKASFCVIGQDQVAPAEYTTYYRSVIAFGTIRIVEDGGDPETRRGLDLLADKYSPEETPESRDAEIGKFLDALYVLVMEIEHLTGKEGKNLAAMRRQKNRRS